MDSSPEPVKDRIRVFILDDHEVVRRGLTDLANQAPDLVVVGEAGTANDALRRIPAAKPDVAILDARLPDGSGIDVCREVRSSWPGTRCLILTSRRRPSALRRRHGGRVGISAETNRRLLSDRCDSPSGRRPVPPRRRGDGQTVGATPQSPAPDPRLAGLTERDRDILNLIADGPTN
jgi:two-component system, NarL family, response regulator DevR